VKEQETTNPEPHHNMPARITLKEETHVLGPQGEVIATLRPIMNGDGFEIEVPPKSVAVAQGTRQGEGGDCQVYQVFLDLDTSDWAEVMYGIY